MTNITLLLVALLVCHYFADFCLTMPMMIRAKADGKNPWPIALHAAIHAVMMGACLLIYGIGCRRILVLMMIEFISHFVLDLSKAKISYKFPYWSNNQHKPYWILYGLDQLLHQMVVILIWQLAITE